MPSPSPPPTNRSSSSSLNRPAVQARSLSTIGRLADDPPLYRTNPATAWERQSLLLWIVRVPDSQDIILTTLQPPPGAQTARVADIESSMYYLHLHESPSIHTPVPAATLIRRDPSTGAQTNVANIIPAPNDRDKLLLELVAPGYTKFVEAVPGNGFVEDNLMYSHHGHHWEQDGVEHDQGPPVLRRVMHIAGSGFWDKVKGFRHSRKQSSQLMPEDGEKESGQHARDKAKKTRDYVFEDLWTTPQGTRGRCEFKDEAGGKYLKCKFYPPPSASQPSPQSMLMSVIEFKLPKFQGHKRAVSAPNDGGAGKVKAKMGMLIIHGAGQDMMDLLVAANMSAFLRRWNHWGKERLALGGW